MFCKIFPKTGEDLSGLLSMQWISYLSEKHRFINQRWTTSINSTTYYLKMCLRHLIKTWTMCKLAEYVVVSVSHYILNIAHLLNNVLKLGVSPLVLVVMWLSWLISLYFTPIVILTYLVSQYFNWAFTYYSIFADLIVPLLLIIIFAVKY